MGNPRAMNCATLWEQTSCPSEEVFSRASDGVLVNGEKIPRMDEVFMEVDHICQECEEYKPMRVCKQCNKKLPEVGKAVIGSAIVASDDDELCGECAEKKDS